VVVIAVALHECSGVMFNVRYEVVDLVCDDTRNEKGTEKCLRMKDIECTTLQAFVIPFICPYLGKHA